MRSFLYGHGNEPADFIRPKKHRPQQKTSAAGDARRIFKFESDESELVNETGGKNGTGHSLQKLVAVQIDRRAVGISAF